MAVSASTGFSGPYTANGSTKVFPFTFAVLATDQVSVISRVSGVDSVVSPASYTVSLSGAAPSAGSVTFGTAPASGQIFVLLSPPFASDAAFENGSAWLAKPVNDGYDASALRDMALRRDVARSMLAPVGETMGALPGAASRAGKVLAFEVGTGAPVAGPDFGGLGTIGAALTAIGTVSASIASVNTVAAAAAAVETAASNIAAINTTASNIAAIIAAPANAATATAQAGYAQANANAASASASAAAASAASALNAPGTSATSTTNLTIGTGGKGPFALVEAGKQFALGQWVTIANTATPTNYMTGQITVFDGTDMTVTVPSGATGGSGTFTAWTISLAAQPGTAGALPTTGGTMTGKLATAASTTGSAGLSVPHGAAPTSPVNGDFWSTTAGFYGRVNGVTVGPFGSGGSPITSSSAQAFAVGQNGNTNPAFNVDASTASSVTGITVKSAAAGAGVTVTATSSAANETLTITGKGTGQINLGSNNGSTIQAFRILANCNQGVDHPLQLASTPLITSPTGGGFEYGSSDLCFFASTDNNQRGVIDVKTLTIQQAGYTLTSTTSAQKAFNGSTNGAVQLAVGTYEFDAVIALTGMSTTSGSFGFALGGTATFTQAWDALSVKAGALANPNTIQGTFNTAANTALTSASVSAAGFTQIKGVLVVTVAGTVIPQVSLQVASAASVNAGSFFKVRKIGSTSVATVGNWS